MEKDIHAILGKPDFGEAYTGRYDWADYRACFSIAPHTGKRHYGCVRVQGGVRGYFIGFEEEEKFVILKNTRKGLEKLAETSYQWRPGQEYKVDISVTGNRISAKIDDISLETIDNKKPYLTGAVGLAVRQGSHLSCKEIRIEGIKKE